MKRIFGWLFPKEEKFFDMLEEQSERVYRSAALLNEFIEVFHEIPTEKKTEYNKRIKGVEKEADGLTHRTIEALNKTFITPLDREDIHRLILLLDDFIDLVKDASNKLVLYRIDTIPEKLKKLNVLILKCSVEIQSTIRDLKKLKDIEVHVKNINEYEEEGDDIYHNAIAELFNNSKETINIIKFSDLYESFEIITDKSKEIANIVWNVGVKHA